MLAPNTQKSETFLVSYVYTTTELNEYHSPYNRNTEPKYHTVEKRAFEFIFKDEIPKYTGYRSVKFYRIEEVFPKVTKHVEIDV